MSQYDVDLKEYWRALAKRRWLILFCMIAVGAGGYAYSQYKQPEPLYRASTEIKIEKHSDMSYVQNAGFWVQNESIESHAYAIKSFSVLKSCAIKIGWLPEGLSDDDVYRDHKWLDVINRLKSSVFTSATKDTNTITIAAVSMKPQEAATIANTIAEAYREVNRTEKDRRTQDMREYLEKQLEMLSEKMVSARSALREFKEIHDMIAVGSKTQKLEGLLDTAKKEHEELREQKRVLSEQLERIRRNQSDEMAEVMAKQLTYASKDSPLYSIGNRLDNLLLERQGLLSKYMEKHPMVMDIDNRIRKIVQDAKSDLEARLRSIEFREKELLGKIERLEAQARELPEKEHRLSLLIKESELQEKLYYELQKKHQDIMIQESGKKDTITVIRPAIAPLGPYNLPSNMAVSFTGLAVGLILGVILAFGLEMMDTSMGSVEDVEASLEAPVLGVIPHFDDGAEGKSKANRISDSERTRDMIAHYDPASLVSEAFRYLRTNLQFVQLEKKSKIYLVTSSFVKEGKTFNAMNLGLTLAQTGDRVLILEADLRQSSVHKIFGLPRSPGVTEYVLGDYDWKEIVNNITDIMLGDFEIEDILKNPGMDNLHLITAGAQPPNPTEILNSERFRRLLREASAEFKYVIIDAPPVLPVADPCEIAPNADGVIFVYSLGRFSKSVLKRARATLQNVDANLVGLILNDIKPEDAPDYFKYYTFYQYANPEEETKKKVSSLRRIAASLF